MGRILVGTSGWLYEHWRGIFFPPKLAARRRLAFLAERFPTVEVNGTFYSLTRPSAVRAWRESVPPGFVFAVKASRYITHLLKLKPERAPLGNFFAQGILRLGEQLGPILWQLPPMLGFDGERAARFFDLVPDDLRGAERVARWHDERVGGRCVLTAPDGRQPLRHALEGKKCSRPWGGFSPPSSFSSVGWSASSRSPGFPSTRRRRRSTSRSKSLPSA